MNFTASSSLATEPSWKYGALLLTLRRLGGLNAAHISGFGSCLNRPTSTSASFGLSVPMPVFWKKPGGLSVIIAVENAGGAWQIEHCALPRNRSVSYTHLTLPTSD